MMKVIGRFSIVGMLGAALSLSAAGGGPAFAAQPVTEHGSYDQPKPSGTPQWKHGLLRRGAEGQVTLDTSRSAVRAFKRQRRRIRNGAGTSCTGNGGNKTRILSARAPDWIEELVDKIAPRYGVDARLVLAVIAVESNFEVEAVSDKNAQGLMQLIPHTAKRFGVKDPFNPAENIKGGIRYLRWLQKHFKNDLSLVLAGYNAGEQAVEKHRGVPPYRETELYVQKVHALYGCGLAHKKKGLRTDEYLGSIKRSLTDRRQPWPPVRQPYDLWTAAASSVDASSLRGCPPRTAGIGLSPSPAAWSQQRICR